MATYDDADECDGYDDGQPEHFWKDRSGDQKGEKKEGECGPENRESFGVLFLLLHGFLSPAVGIKHPVGDEKTDSNER